MRLARCFDAAHARHYWSTGSWGPTGQIEVVISDAAV